MSNFEDIKKLLDNTESQKTASNDDNEMSIELTEEHLEKIASLVYDKIKDNVVKHVEEKTAEYDEAAYEKLHRDAVSLGQSVADSIVAGLQKHAAATVQPSAPGEPSGGDPSLIFSQLKALGNLRENPKNMTNIAGQSFPNGGGEHPAGKRKGDSPEIWDGKHAPKK